MNTNIERIIQAWKDEEDQWDDVLPICPVGEELTEEELLLVDGGCNVTCGITIYCTYTCGFTA